MKLEELKNNIEVLQSMVDFLYADSETGGKHEELNDVGYTQKHIDKCQKILNDYIDSLVSVKEPRSDNGILKCVKKAVEQLNKLNEKCDCSLIETDQREDLVPYIQKAAKLAGLTLITEDVTAEWRDW
jgi:hypothetical protein